MCLLCTIRSSLCKYICTDAYDGLCHVPVLHELSVSRQPRVGANLGLRVGDSVMGTQAREPKKGCESSLTPESASTPAANGEGVPQDRRARQCATSPAP